MRRIALPGKRAELPGLRACIRQHLTSAFDNSNREQPWRDLRVSSALGITMAFPNLNDERILHAIAVELVGEAFVVQI